MVPHPATELTSFLLEERRRRLEHRRKTKLFQGTVNAGMWSEVIPSLSDMNETSAAIARWADSVGNRLLRALSPIYVERQRTPTLLGSGVLIRLAEQVFLVSAAHVADDTVSMPCYFGTTELITLPKLRWSSPMPESGDRRHDPIDLAYWVLGTEMQSRLTCDDAFEITELDAFDPASVPPEEQYFLNGYPASRQRRRFDPQAELPVGTLAFLTAERPVAEYEIIKRARSSSLFVSYEKSHFYSEGQKQRGPDLPGVSGGALWRVSGPGCSMQQPLLSGIVTTWRVAPPYGVVGTRIRTWLNAVARQYPHIMAAAMTSL